MRKRAIDVKWSSLSSRVSLFPLNRSGTLMLQKKMRFRMLNHFGCVEKKINDQQVSIFCKACKIQIIAKKIFHDVSLALTPRLKVCVQ